MLLLAGVPAALHAQATTKRFVASYGNDANDGTRNAPKRNFQAAHDAANSGDEIVVLDTAGYGTLNITKGITIIVPPGVNGFVTAAGSASGIVININGGGTVLLRGLIIEGNFSGNEGIRVNPGTTVLIEDCSVRAFGAGISSTGGVLTHLVIRGCSLRDVQYGIMIASTSSSLPVDAVVVNCAIDNAVQTALSASSTGSGSRATLIARDCVVTNSGTAFSVGLDNGAMIYADNCLLSGNSKAVDVLMAGQVITRGNNTLVRNGGTGVFTGTLSAQ